MMVIEVYQLFWEKQDHKTQQDYIKMLQILGSLSNLFSDSKTPYLYYRVHENLFCDVFNAKNLSRGDISFDASKDGIGIGLKTFLNGNGKTFQKVAEFNSDSDILRNLSSDEEIIFKVSELRNKRIKITKNITNVKDAVYHLITREEGSMRIVETPMDLVDINSIRIPKEQAKNTIRFSDKYNEYSFSLSKNTLLKRFDTSDNNLIINFDVEILTNPFDLLKQLLDDKYIINPIRDDENAFEYIILPLYSTRTDSVPERSGLNQWNASGRKRDFDEVYIPIPSWIHDKFSDFFVYSRNRSYPGESAKNSPAFDVELPDGKIINCKIAQQGGKALMSNPNKDLGKWLLRDVLNLKHGELLTKKMLDEIGIDSVKLSKVNDDKYILDFTETGEFEKFEMNNRE